MLHIYCQLIFFFHHSLPQLKPSYFLSQNYSDKITVFPPRQILSRVVHTRLLCVGPIYYLIFLLPTRSQLQLSCIWLCSCCSLHPECLSLHWVLGKIISSFPRRALHSPLFPSHFTQDFGNTYKVVSHPHVGAFVLPVLKSLLLTVFFPTQIQFTSVPSSGLFASLPSQRNHL